MAEKDDSSGSVARVAFELMEKVMTAEKKTEKSGQMIREDFSLADRQYILDLYVECQRAVTGLR